MDGLRISAVARDLALRSGEVAAVISIAAKKLKGEAGALKAIEAIDGLRRAPVLGGHGVSSLLFVC
ncbi:hypothetical protein IVB52_38345 [Bradyrhizobium sp. CW11]|nr:hypothetical protein [Bradyrhizobium sp. CW11]MCK1587886.1 hypothetical protein [Bradyrhizobium sp. 169]